MESATHFRFSRRPSQASLFVTAVRNSRPLRRPPAQARAMRASWHGLHIDQSHLNAFNAACGMAAQAEVSILYPMTWAYPLLLRMLSDRAAPMPLFHALNTKMEITQHRPLSMEDRFDLDLAVTGVRRLDKGLEMDIHVAVRHGADLAWESVMTFYYRGRFDAPLDAAPPDALARIAEVGTSHEWAIPPKGAFRFGRLCGDTNPLHYGKFYAKAFGFERDFAQPLRVLGQALHRIGPLAAPFPIRLVARLKAPVYYERALKMPVADLGHGRRFDIYCSPNDRPSICGLWG